MKQNQDKTKQKTAASSIIPPIGESPEFFEKEFSPHDMHLSYFYSAC